MPSLSDAADDDEVYKKVKAKHPGMANLKLRFCAKLISRGRYEDYDNVPPIPLLQEDFSGDKNNLSDALVYAAVAFAETCRSSHVANASPQRATTFTGISSELSPMKYMYDQLHRSSLEDLKTLKSLYKENVISESEFTDVKERILSTLKSPMRSYNVIIVQCSMHS